jgi:hypothetical protein
MNSPDSAKDPGKSAHELGEIAMSDPIAMSNPLATMGSGEQVICEIKRHPIGMFGIYMAVSFLIVVLGVLLFAVAPSLATNSHGQVVAISIIIFIIAAAASTGFLFIANKIYWGNRWIVTSDSITQITRTSLFDKQTSQLSLSDLEDITAAQDGILPQMFHYGILSAETAAATDKFTFIYCPNPTYYARSILGARERFEHERQRKPAS